MKRLICKGLVVALLLSLCLAAVPCASAEGEMSGTCGDGITWELDGDTLTISGSGPMEDFDSKAPWYEYREQIGRVVFTGGVTTVGMRSFEDYDSLKEVDFGSAMHTIGAYAFRYCDALERVHLPDTFRIFDVECFRECKNLHAIHCEGPFPSFKGSCMWGTTVNIYYPASNPWPLSLVVELEKAFDTWIEFLDSDGNDPYTYGGNGLRGEKISAVMVEETQPEATEPEETKPAETEAVEPETVEAAVVMAETVPETTQPETTEPAAEPEATAEETTEETWVSWTMATTAPTEAEASASRGISGGTVGLILVGAVFALTAIGAIIFRISNRGGKYGR